MIPIEIPPLRERREDIPVLVDHFLEKHRQRTGRKIDRVDDGVIAALERATSGRAMCASWKTPSSARSCDHRFGDYRERDLAGQDDRHRQGCHRCDCTRTSSGSSARRFGLALEQAGGIKKDAAELMMGISQRALSYYLANANRLSFKSRSDLQRR